MNLEIPRPKFNILFPFAFQHGIIPGRTARLSQSKATCVAKLGGFILQ